MFWRHGPAAFVTLHYLLRHFAIGYAVPHVDFVHLFQQVILGQVGSFS